MKYFQTARWVFLCTLCLILLLNHASASIETDEFEDIPDSSGVAEVALSSDELDSSSDNEGKVRPKLSFRQLLYESGDISGQNNFFIEISFLCLLGLCVWNYVYGKITNRILAIKWIAVNKEILAEQFSLLSAACNAEPNPDELLSQEKGYNVFRFYASGRKHCTAFFAEISLLKRNDIFWRIIDALAFPSYDTVKLQTVLSTDTTCHNVLFFLCRKGKQVSIRDENASFGEFTSQVSTPTSISDLVTFSEVPEALEKLFMPDDWKTLNDLSDYVELISVTDLNTEEIEGVVENSPPPRVLTCVFRLPSPGEMDKIVPLTELSLRLVDTLFSLRLSTGGKNKVDRNRKVLTDRVAKAVTERRLLEDKEENEKKKLEKIEKEKEEYEKLPDHLKVKRDMKEDKKKKKEERKSMMKKK